MKNRKRLLKTIISIAVACVIALAFFASAGMWTILAEEEELPFNRAKVSFPKLTLELGEKAAEREKKYTFELTADEEGSPMPAVTKLEMTEAGEAVFGDVIFSLPGDYYYSVEQTTEDEEGFILDKTVYRIRVFAYLVDEASEDDPDVIVTPDRLKAEIILGKEGEAAKATEIIFKNDYDLFGLRIEKNLNLKEEFEGRTDPATFVFSVDMYWQGELVKSDVVSMVFTGAGSDYVEIEEIPAGTEVVVKEVYAGGNYIVSGSGEVTVVVDPYEPAVASFTNDYNNTWKGGGSVTNTISDGSTAAQSYSDGRTVQPAATK